MTEMRWPLPFSWWGLDRGFLWILKSGQYEDLDGSAERILIDREDPRG
ncbi:cytochrome oxidase maturation protein Cbb3 [Mesorhizobium sp. LNHC232B00]|nr:cytochrome oxidase maturation protein Cbb3 [Mesorhizobium sp. LNHC232B00]